MLTLGIDCSTQGVKAVVWDATAKKVVATSSVNYGKDLPQYKSPDGFLPSGDVLVRHANPQMWLDAVEMVLSKLQYEGCDMGKIAAIGGDAQQHATVYLESFEPLVFSRSTSPIWMDSSTSRECAELDSLIGTRLREDTGSPAIERFAAAQVKKFANNDPLSYEKTKRIHLLSSFLSSYLAGEEMPIDLGDGAGMNLLNLKTCSWDEEICKAVAEGLIDKLPRIAKDFSSSAGKLSKRFERYGLRAGIPVVPFTGDNPASLVGCFAESPGVAVISLGTSDVFFAAMDSYKVDPDGYGHVFGNPAGGFMSLSCVKNGSLARNRIREELGVDWRFFDETAFERTPPGNNGKRAFPFFEEEITPKHCACGIEASFNWDDASSEEKIRAIVEGQISNLRDRTRWIGEFEEIKLTGGASLSKGIRSVVADIFGAKVSSVDVSCSAAVGGARLAERGVE